MILSGKKKEEAIDILKNYNGKNSEILRLKNKFLSFKYTSFSDLNYEYILTNHGRERPELIDRDIKIADWYGTELAKRYDLGFVPKTIHVYTFAGETQTIYHCWVKFKPEQDKYISLFIPKRALLGQLLERNYEDCFVDVDRLNKMLEVSERKMLEHQISGVKFLLTSKKCILADEMGLSKTATSIAASICGEFNHILIISPASVKSTWKKELSFFGITDVEIIQGTDRNTWDLSKKYCIVNYDIFDKHLHEVVYTTIIDEYTGKPKKIKSRNKEKIEEVSKQNPLIQANFDLIIIDEVHKLSNSTSNRYKAILDYIQKSNLNNIWILSGTPISNSHSNYYHILRLINAEIANDYRNYMFRYCGGKEFTLKTGRKVILGKESTNGDELRERTKHLYLRRLKSEIKGLPQRTIIEKYFDLSSTERIEYEKLWEEYEKKQVELGNVDKNNLDTLNKQLVEGTLYRQFLAEAMVKHTIELAESWIEEGSKIIIGCCYNKELELFKDYFKNKCVVFHGGMTPKQKDNTQDEFMNNPKVKVFVGNIIAAGVGLTLTSSNVLILNSLDYVPGNISQLMDRNYRISQKKDVYSYFMLFNNTHAEWMWNKIIKKQLIINTVIVDEKNK